MGEVTMKGRTNTVPLNDDLANRDRSLNDGYIFGRKTLSPMPVAMFPVMTKANI